MQIVYETLVSRQRATSVVRDLNIPHPNVILPLTTLLLTVK